MILYWKIRYLDRAAKQFKDRELYLDARTLDPVSRAAIELVAENNHSQGGRREILKYRHLFIEGAFVSRPFNPQELVEHKGFFIYDYFEDEAGKEVSSDEMAQIMTGNPAARAIPHGARKHDIDLMLAEQKPVPLAEVALSSEETRIFGYFVRDLEELLNSAFIKDGPGSLTSSGTIPTVRTAVSDEEIRSFVTIFRRLYMENEPANFRKAVELFVNALGDHPLGKWVEGTAKEYETRLAATPDSLPCIPSVTFTTTRLIDIHLYTQYAHQPDARRQRQYEECLAELQGKRAILTWLFLTEMWKCALEIINAGNRIAWWFKPYCQHHGISPDVLNSLRRHHSGLGVAEKEEDRRKRLFNEKVEQLAEELWQQAGRPEGGSKQFLVAARERLSQAI